MKTKLLLSAVAAFGVASLQAQTVTITNLTTGEYFNDSDGWSHASDPLWEGQNGWTGTGTGADSVSDVGTYTPGSPANSASGTLGVFLPALPLNTTTPYVQHSFTPMDPGQYDNINVTYTAEWSILDFGGGSVDDTFTFDLRNVGNTASVLAFTMNNVGTGGGFDYTLSSVGSGTVAQFDTTYGALLRMQVDVSGTGYGGTWELLDPTTRGVLDSGTLNGGTLAGGYTASDIGNLRLGWELASGDASDPGNLGIVVNQFEIQSEGEPIPEPGTWAMGALLLSGAAAGWYRRRKAAAKQAA